MDVLASAEHAREVAEKLLRATTERGVSLPTVGSGHVQPISVSIGLASADNASQVDLDTLVQQADRALYDAKRAGRACIVNYQPPPLRKA